MLLGNDLGQDNDTATNLGTGIIYCDGVNDVSCFGCSDDTFSFTAGGTAPFNISWRIYHQRSSCLMAIR